MRDNVAIIVKSFIKLADNPANLDELDACAHALHLFTLSDDSHKLQHIFYDLSEYIELRSDQHQGKPVNEPHMHRLRKELLSGC